MATSVLLQRKQHTDGRGAQENWLLVYGDFCKNKSLPDPSICCIPIKEPTVNIPNLTEGLTLQSYIFT